MCLHKYSFVRGSLQHSSHHLDTEDCTGHRNQFWARQSAGLRVDREGERRSVWCGRRQASILPPTLPTKAGSGRVPKGGCHCSMWCQHHPQTVSVEEEAGLWHPRASWRPLDSFLSPRAAVCVWGCSPHWPWLLPPERMPLVGPPGSAFSSSSPPLFHFLICTMAHPPNPLLTWC